jgi:hypothetical protein
MSFEIVKTIKTITVKENKLPISCWRLIHDGKKVINLIHGNGKTSTTQSLFCGTKKECEDEIARLKLEYVK